LDAGDTQEITSRGEEGSIALLAVRCALSAAAASIAYDRLLAEAGCTAVAQRPPTRFSLVPECLMCGMCSEFGNFTPASLLLLSLNSSCLGPPLLWLRLL
jgi:hypothetical protein